MVTSVLQTIALLILKYILLHDGRWREKVESIMIKMCSRLWN